jgi:hypothetical protein
MRLNTRHDLANRCERTVHCNLTPVSGLMQVGKKDTLEMSVGHVAVRYVHVL